MYQFEVSSVAYFFRYGRRVSRKFYKINDWKRFHMTEQVKSYTGFHRKHKNDT